MNEPIFQGESGEPLSGRALLLQDIGSKLTQAREAKREPINKPVHILKIPVYHLQALENGDWNALPDDVYVIGFLRQYSNYLNIDLSDEIEHLKNKEYSLKRPLTFPDPPVAPSRRWAWLTGAAFVVLFIVFNIMNFNVDVDETDMQDEIAVADVLDIPSVSTENQMEIGHAANLSQTNNEQQASVKEPSVASLPALAALVAEKPLDVVPIDAHARQTSVYVDPSKQLGISSQDVATSVHVFRFEAVTGPVWLQIFLPNKAGNGKGRLLKEVLLKKGRYSIIKRATESLWITCGNALALRIYVDKKVVVETGGLSSNGKKVLRDYHFDISQL